MRQFLATTLMAVITFGPLVNANAAPAGPPARSVAGTPATPITHLVVIFQENVSFDHYFATYPNATNPQGEPPFTGFQYSQGQRPAGRPEHRQSELESRAMARARPIPSAWIARRPRPPIRTTITRRNRWPSMAA